MARYRIALLTSSIPLRHEALAEQLRPALNPHTRHLLAWAVLRRIGDNAEAEILLDPHDARQPDGTIDLSTIPAERIVRQPAA